MTSITPSSSKKRIEIIDALRGFALAGIVVVHLVENYIGGPPPDIFQEAVHQGVADSIVDGFVNFFLRGKFFALFSFLFGLSFFIQMDNAAQKGGYFGGRFLWRLILLLGIGYAHSLFYAGDILTVYAMLGVFLIPFYKMKNKWVLLCSALLFLGLGRFLVFGFTHGENLFGDLTVSGDDPQVVAYYNTLKDGSLMDVFSINAWTSHLNKMDFQFGVFGRGYLTFGFFLLGLYVGRTGFFKKYRESKKLIKRTWIWSLVLFLISGVAMAFIFGNIGPDVKFDNWLVMLGLTAYDVSNVAMTLIYISVFVILYKRTKTQMWLSKFAPYGKMALTNYFFQSVFGTFLLFGWGLGMIGELRNLYTFALSLMIVAIQMFLSKWWLKRFQYGPLEWLWRSATFLKSFPLKKTN
ncbi:DUF418 domain-containing protein [Muricauda sp. JGD-17]|uniref:DUF418 domain-containing protein n=1 Tax=Flagellimonas ochracea TaxID=2696472 RepID=A0A964TA09_9FLAO|nr:DUF418 domain-containing protein [Allomuricauda ochracea]NAY90992.1 DUF418 domain-containing protein [Allomuricauda ochracea]